MITFMYWNLSYCIKKAFLVLVLTGSYFFIIL